jgi:hypothetical protein
MYDLSELILVGSNISEWSKNLDQNSLNAVHYINVSGKIRGNVTAPHNWHVYTEPLGHCTEKFNYYE